MGVYRVAIAIPAKRACRALRDMGGNLPAQQAREGAIEEHSVPLGRPRYGRVGWVISRRRDGIDHGRMGLLAGTPEGEGDDPDLGRRRQFPCVAVTADLGLGFGDVFLQSIATIPAVWAVVGIAVAVIGARPRVRPAIWLGVLVSFVLTILGPSFKLPDWALGFSPFHHVPDVSAAQPDWWGLVWVGVVVVVLVALGFAGFRRRDIP